MYLLFVTMVTEGIAAIAITAYFVNRIILDWRREQERTRHTEAYHKIVCSRLRQDPAVDFSRIPRHEL